MKLTQRTRNDMTQNINLFDAATLEILRKFNANKNAEALANDLEPGTYERTITVTISGSLTKAAPKVTRPRDRKGVSHIVHWALDRMTDAEFSALLRDLDKVKAGQYSPKSGTYAERLDAIMPRIESESAGAVSFNDALVYVDAEVEGRLDTEDGRGKGLTVIDRQSNG